MKRGKGFTLLDVVAIVAVFGIIPPLVWPSLMRARESARRAACLTNLKMMILGIKTYTPDYDEYYPTSAAPGKEISVKTHYRDLGILYPNYISFLEVFTCPSSGDWMPEMRRDDSRDAKPFDDREAEQMSYAYSYDGSGGRNRPWTEAAPSETRVLADRPAATELTPQSNHKTDGRIVCFADGHVKWISGKGKLLTNPNHPDPKLRTASWWSERSGEGKARRETKPEVQYFARMSSLHPHNSFYSYAAVQTARMEDDQRMIRELRRRRRPWEPERSREADLYSMTTGLLSIQESLQLDVMLQGEGAAEDRTVPIADLAPPKTRSLPFDEMLGDAEPQVSALSEMIPEDQYFISFRSVGRAQAFMDFYDTWGEHCLKHYSLSAKKALTREKLETQMCVRDLWFARPITNLAVGEIALTGSHPFVAQGDDFSLILQLKMRSIFDPAIARFVELAKKKRPDAEEEPFRIGEHDVYALVTGDREISHYRADIGAHTVISNSKEAIRRILETIDGKRPSLARAEDFRYMRSILEHDDPGESGFVYLSETFIRRQIGPEAKIAQARRLRCGTALKMIANAAILFKHLHGKFPDSLDEMIEARCIAREYLVCPAEGTYSWKPGALHAVCSVHNRLRYLTPIVELKTDLANKKEKEEYGQFVERYNQYWRTFFDPVGIRISMAPSGLTLETHILPLVQNSIYDAVTEFSGGAPVALSPQFILPETILSIQGCVSDDLPRDFFGWLWDDIARRREERFTLTAEEEVAREQAESDLQKAFGHFAPEIIQDISDTMEMLGVREIVEEIVGEVDEEEIAESARVILTPRLKGSLNFCDGSMLFGIQAGETGGFQMRGAGLGLSFGVAALALNFPFYISIDVPDPAALERVLSYTAATLAHRRPDWTGMNEKIGLYQVAPYRDRKVYVLEGGIGPIQLRGFITLIGKEAYVTLRLPVLKGIIDLAEDGEASPAAADSTKANVALLIRPKAWDRVKGDFQFAWASSAKEACIANLDELQVLHKYFAGAEFPMTKIAERVDGIRYFCPEGGEHHFDTSKDNLSCSVHGFVESQSQPETMSQGSRFLQLIEGIDQINVSLAFESQGVKTRVEMTFKDGYRPFGL